MDLRTYLRVIWRFRLVVLAGFVLAIALAVLSYVKITPHGVAYRQGETWKATTTLIVSRESAPLGAPSSFGSGSDTQLSYSQLAFFYAGLANSDPVQRLMAQQAHVAGIVQAQPSIDQLTRIIMPFINLTAFARTQDHAVRLANGAAEALQTYVQHQQDLAGTPPRVRVSLPQVSRATSAVLSAGRRKTTPIVIFLTVMIAAIGLAFILENLRPRVHIVGRDVDDVPTSDRRSA